MSTIHLHLHIDNTPTQELPAIDPEVPALPPRNSLGQFQRQDRIIDMQGKEIGELKTELASLQADLAEITKASVDLAAQLANRKGYDFGHITTAFKRVFEGHRIAEIDGTITIHKTPSELLQDLLKELPNV